VKLYERFFRVDHSADSPDHGLGLSRELARARGGDLALGRSDEN
jgi:hypothetical protein